MRFAYPLFLILIPVLALLIVLWEKKKRRSVITFSSARHMADINPSPKVKLRRLPTYLRYTAFLLLLLALARPQAGQDSEEVYNQGIDIMMVLDTSTSMRAIDFKPANRFEAAKRVSRDFVEGRQFDRIGIVIFSGLAFTQCPLTADHEAILNFLDQTSIGMTEVDGTAIGSAIATATNRLKGSPGKSKIMILITDGRNNAGEIDPFTAAQAAAAMNVKIYTIGAGRPGGAEFPVDYLVFGQKVTRYEKIPEQELDEDTLAKIAEITSGRYFRATDSASLSKILKQIDSMEKTEIKTVKYTNYTELFSYFLWPAFILMLLEILLAHVWLRKLP